MLNTYHGRETKLEDKVSRLYGLGSCGDIILECLKPYRPVLKLQPTSDCITNFYRDWLLQGDIDDPTQQQHINLVQVIRNRFPYYDNFEIQEEFHRVTQWMSIYTRRCDNFHSNLKKMNAQALWDYVKTTIREVANGTSVFIGIEGNYVLDALERYLDDQFMEINGTMKYVLDGTIISR